MESYIDQTVLIPLVAESDLELVVFFPLVNYCNFVQSVYISLPVLEIFSPWMVCSPTSESKMRHYCHCWELKAGLAAYFIVIRKKRKTC